jgi:hypothetical protein
MSFFKRHEPPIATFKNCADVCGVYNPPNLTDMGRIFSSMGGVGGEKISSKLAEYKIEIFLENRMKKEKRLYIRITSKQAEELANFARRMEKTRSAIIREIISQLCSR